MSYCECSCDFSDYHAAEAFECDDVIARKKHRCCECGCEIGIGEQYERVSGLWDGGWDRFATCRLCALIRDDICACAPYGYMREAIEEQLGFDYMTGEVTHWARREDERTKQ